MSIKRNAQSKEKLFTESPWYISNMLSRLDRFGEPVPAFNIKGKD